MKIYYYTANRFLGWRFVGEAYMHGIMEGEVKDLLLESEDEFGEQIFRIE
jgi:hypothetical protein